MAEGSNVDAVSPEGTDRAMVSSLGGRVRPGLRRRPGERGDENDQGPLARPAPLLLAGPERQHRLPQHPQRHHRDQRRVTKAGFRLCGARAGGSAFWPCGTQGQSGYVPVAHKATNVSSLWHTRPLLGALCATRPNSYWPCGTQGQNVARARAAGRESGFPADGKAVAGGVKHATVMGEISMTFGTESNHLAMQT